MKEPEYHERNRRSVDHLDKMATMLDSQYRIPGTQWRFGADAIIGLVPGAGDLATTALAAYIVWRARKMGISRWAQTKMITNVFLDTTLGAIPLVGDAFDVWLKANKRNIRIIEKDLRRSGRYYEPPETV